MEGRYSTLLPSSMRSMLRQLQQGNKHTNTSRAGRVFSITHSYKITICWTKTTCLLTLESLLLFLAFVFLQDFLAVVLGLLIFTT